MLYIVLIALILLFFLIKARTRHGNDTDTEHTSTSSPILTTITIGEGNPVDVQISELSRKATEYKKIDIQKSVECLYQVKELYHKSSISYTIQSYLRLPLYLQQAGRFDDAMKEFDLLLESTYIATGIVPDWSEYQLSPKEKENFIHNMKAIIYDKMRLACKREGLKELADEYAKLSEYHADLFHPDID